MQKVRHDFLGNTPIWLQEFFANVDKVNMLAVVKLGNNRVDFL